MNCCSVSHGNRIPVSCDTSVMNVSNPARRLRMYGGEMCPGQQRPHRAGGRAGIVDGQKPGAITGGSRRLDHHRLARSARVSICVTSGSPCHVATWTENWDGRRAGLPLEVTKQIALGVGKVVNKYKMAKHFQLDNTETSFSFARDETSIAAEAATDRVYVIRTSLLAAREAGAHVVRGCRQRRCRGRAEQHRGEGTTLTRGNQQTDYRRHRHDGLPVYSFRTLLTDLASLTRNTVVTTVTPDYPLTVLARPTPIQRQAFELLELAM
jgi:hypothetical protein